VAVAAQPVELVEDPFSLGRWHPGAVVDDAQLHPPVQGPAGEGDRLAVGVAAGVIDQVGEDLVESDRVDHARELARLWAKVQIPIPLELVDAPDRNLPATVEETVAERVRPDTEVTVLVPRRRYVGFWRRVLHDQTSAELTKVLSELDNVNVTIVPFRLRHRRLQSVSSDGPTTATTRPPHRQPSPWLLF
jgi:hypothetical protein